MCNYCKPVVLMNEELAEGVYAASGSTSVSNCWTLSVRETQHPETGRGDYRYQLDAHHDNADRHLSSFTATIVFNQPVEVAETPSVDSVSVSGNTITLYCNITTYNPNEDKGLGCLRVVSDAGLKISSTSISCNGLGIHQ